MRKLPTKKQRKQRQLAWAKYQLLSMQGRLSCKFFDELKGTDIYNQLAFIYAQIDYGLRIIDIQMRNIK